ncbi:MAG: DNA-processing protein DprA, partial [Lancefieldella parvula]
MKRWEISSEDEDYPSELLLLNHPPEIIYGIGDRSVLQEPCMSVIGARRATPYGMAIAEMSGRCAADKKSEALYLVQDSVAGLDDYINGK